MSGGRAAQRHAAAARRARILQLVSEQEGLRSTELAVTLDVSVATVRRDISAIASHPLVRRVHGGLVATTDPRRPRRTRAVDDQAAGTSSLPPEVGGCRTLGLGPGPQSARVAAALPMAEDMTVVSASLDVTRVLLARGWPAGRLVTLPGVVGPGGALTGPWTTDALRRLRLDLAVCDVDSDGPEAVVVTALTKASRVTLLLDRNGARQDH